MMGILRYKLQILGCTCGFGAVNCENLQSVSMPMLNLKRAAQPRLRDFLGRKKRNEQFGHGNQADIDFQMAMLGEKGKKKQRECEKIKFPEHNWVELFKVALPNSEKSKKGLDLRKIEKDEYSADAGMNIENGGDCSQHSFSNKLKTPPGVLNRGFSPKLTVPSTRWRF